MRKLRLYKYDHAPGQVHDTIPEYRNSVPFSEDGIAKWCELVGPQEAELFYCGQYNEKNAWLLQQERFEHFSPMLTAHKHVFDLEGDHSEEMFLQWMRGSIITAMNARPDHRNWRCMVRPGCSMLLMDMVRNPRKVSAPTKHGFYFRGQRDQAGVREKLRAALRVSGVPHQFDFMPNWNAPTPVDHADVRRYEAEMLEWSMALCPSGTGQMSVRYFEACALTRCPVVVADNLLFAEDVVGTPVRVDPSLTVAQMARRLRVLYESPELVRDVSLEAAALFAENVASYFADPTLYLLARLQNQGLLDGNEWHQALKEFLAKDDKVFSCQVV